MVSVKDVDNMSGSMNGSLKNALMKMMQNKE